jgi:hypothetical protein
MQVADWWLYVFCGIMLRWFIGPVLISAPDTVLVVLGVVLWVGFGIWSYYLWIKPVSIWAFNKLKEEMK